MSNIRVLPAVEERVETGPIQFGDDWPGVFIRGDNAFNFMINLDMALDDPRNVMSRMQVDWFRQTMAGCITGPMSVAFSEPLNPEYKKFVAAWRRLISEAPKIVCAGCRQELPIVDKMHEPYPGLADIKFKCEAIEVVQYMMAVFTAGTK